MNTLSFTASPPFSSSSPSAFHHKTQKCHFRNHLPLAVLKNEKKSNSYPNSKSSPPLRRPGAPAAHNPPHSEESEASTSASNPFRGFSAENYVRKAIKSNENFFDDRRSVSSASHPTRSPVLEKLWLSSTLLTEGESDKESPSTQKAEAGPEDQNSDDEDNVAEVEETVSEEFREKGKVFVGNLPVRATKREIAEYFRQFGPLKSVILIRAHNDPQKNAGFGFVIYGGPSAEEWAMKAVEFDGAEFQGRALTIKLDNGQRRKVLLAHRRKWIEGGDSCHFRSSWHEERFNASNHFRKILETHPDNWQMIVDAFCKINKPTRQDYALMVKYYGRRGDKHHARSTFESMRAKGIEPNSYAYTNLVLAYAVARDMRGAVACVEEMKSEKIQLNLATYSILICGFGNIRDTKAAEFWFQEAKNHFTSLNSVIYMNIIDAHCKVGNMERAELLVRQMEEEGIQAPLNLYHVMMDGYANIMDESKCIAVFERLMLGKLSKALAIAKEMEAYGIKHNKHTYSMLIDGYIKLNDCANAFTVFEEMMMAGFKPDVVSYNMIINGFCKIGNIDRAVRVLDRMLKEKQNPSPKTYTTIVHGFAKVGNVEMASEMVKQMRRQGCIPTIVTYNAFIHGLVINKKLENAVRIIDEMILAGIPPNERTYTIIMQGYAHAGDIGRAFEYFTRMKDDGLMPDILSYSELLKACCKAGRMQSALAVTKEMCAAGHQRNTHIYNILIDGWARRADVWEAADLMQQMRQEGIPADVHTYTSFINACSKAGDMDRASAALKEMTSMGIEPNLKTYTALLHGWALASQPEKALSCLEDMKQSGLKPDDAVYHCIMTSLLSMAGVAKEYVYDGILRISREMRDFGYVASMDTAIHWSKALQKLERVPGELTNAVEMLFPPTWDP
eukprot:TRINITY_DN1423_c0_g1_i3.p1 TRINITY_DN1423_c0_g1~~TRINITY_DN1423_c0_g1_i3.p1  ORF type:complete len:901 (+),score=161.52 TRINITY_DN1423_c0_g1_i3:50-2752(+)